MKLVWIALGLLALTLCAHGDDPRSPPIDSRAQRASNQKSAIKLAKLIDLPALKDVDRLMVTLVVEPDADSPKPVNISDQRSLKRVKSLLRLNESPPSAGMPWVHLTWFADDKPVRRIWLMADGEWGFVRKGTSWTSGTNRDLVKFLKAELHKRKTAGESGRR